MIFNSQFQTLGSSDNLFDYAGQDYKSLYLVQT